VSIAERVDQTPTVPPDEMAVPRTSRVRLFVEQRVAFAALVVLVALPLACVLAGVLPVQDPNLQVPTVRLGHPTTDNWLGADNLGRDNLARLLYGGRVTLLAAVQAVGVAVILGVPLGVLAGLAGRWVDAVLRTCMDALMSIPPLLLAFAIVGVLGPGLTNAMLAVGIVMTPRFQRVARSGARQVARETYIEASRAAGCSPWRLLWRHVLPNASGPLLVQISFSIGFAVTAEASLSFLGLGVQAPQASWGSMVRESFNVIRRDSWQIVPPSVAIAATLLATSLVGDGIRDAINRSGGGRSAGARL